ncbi:Protein EMSY-LIKE 3 [Dichanthelium oligosanthes]|uniref:Protein EMSY-LIKE 3 n=1 Tax=Dichanthelium oligosanthes TaxID=888268 RepID=A0A1E5UTE9_9POAL|nr:Protein EMSY-LIKE 3 [Dichanthelium oligosanthes]
MGNPYIPRVMRLQEQGSSEPSELNCRYNAPTAKNIGDLNAAHSWVQAHPEEHKMIRTSLELLMSQSRKAHQPNFSGSSYGGDLANATNSQVHDTAYSFKGHKMMIQMPLDMLMSQSRNVCPQNLSGSTYAAEMASFANPQVHSTAHSSNGHWMIQPPMDLLMSQSRNVGRPNSTGSAVGGEPTNVPSSQDHGTVYSSNGHKMIQTPLEMLMSQSRNVCPPNLSGSTCGVELASVANPQVYSTAYSSRGHRMIQTPMDLLMSESRNGCLPNSTCSAVGKEPKNIPSSQVHGTAYSSMGHNMIQTPLEMLMSPSRNVCPPNLSGSTRGVELASVANPQVHNTSYSSRGHGMIQTAMDLLMSQSRNVGLPNSTGSAVGGEPTNIRSSQVHGTVYSSKGHNMIQTPLEMLMSQSRNVCPPNLSGSTCGVELSSVANTQVHNTACSSRGQGMIQTPMDLLMPESRNFGLPDSTVSTVGGEPTNVPSLQVHGTAYSSSRTDDDLPPPDPNNRDMSGSGHVSGDGRAIVPANSQTDMEAQIHQLEQEAYCSVLRAFKAQSDTITWEKEGLITELREELRVSDEGHRQILNKINNDDLIHRIREWRATGGPLESLPNNPIHDPVSSHSTSARKRQKTSKSVTASLAPSPVMHSQRVATPTQPSSSTATKAVPLGIKGKKTKPCQKVPGGSAVKPTSSSEGPSARGPQMNRYFPGGPPAEFSQAQSVNPLIGRKFMNRWPDDNSFYEVVISDYNPETGLYALVYDINTSNETWEWVDLRKVEKVCSANNPNPLEVEEAKRALKKQEHALVDAIARLSEASDEECGTY